MDGCRLPWRLHSWCCARPATTGIKRAVAESATDPIAVLGRTKLRMHKLNLTCDGGLNYRARDQHPSVRSLIFGGRAYRTQQGNSAALHTVHSTSVLHYMTKQSHCEYYLAGYEAHQRNIISSVAAIVSERVQSPTYTSHTRHHGTTPCAPLLVVGVPGHCPPGSNLPNGPPDTRHSGRPADAATPDEYGILLLFKACHSAPR
jgi:hypothetical protein